MQYVRSRGLDARGSAVSNIDTTFERSCRAIRRIHESLHPGAFVIGGCSAPKPVRVVEVALHVALTPVDLVTKFLPCSCDHDQRSGVPALGLLSRRRTHTLPRRSRNASADARSTSEYEFAAASALIATSRRRAANWDVDATTAAHTSSHATAVHDPESRSPTSDLSVHFSSAAPASAALAASNRSSSGTTKTLSPM